MWGFGKLFLGSRQQPYGRRADNLSPENGSWRDFFV
jgi:hypothetical protein